MSYNIYEDYLMHYGVKGMRWRNKKGTQDTEIKRRYDRRNAINSSGQPSDNVTSGKAATGWNNIITKAAKRVSSWQNKPSVPATKNVGKKFVKSALMSQLGKIATADIGIRSDKRSRSSLRSDKRQRNKVTSSGNSGRGKAHNIYATNKGMTYGVKKTKR